MLTDFSWTKCSSTGSSIEVSFMKLFQGLINRGGEGDFIKPHRSGCGGVEQERLVLIKHSLETHRLKQRLALS